MVTVSRTVEEQAFEACVKTQNKRGFQPRCLRDTPTLELLWLWEQQSFR
jgi:hypothetical protein